MKKNRMMRLASVLLVLTLLSTSVISGTFAKYTTSVDAQDSARVARWGFTGTDANIAITDLFKSAYQQGTGDSNVLGEGGANIIAPGTTNSAQFQFIYSATGDNSGTDLTTVYAPEVAYSFVVSTDGSSIAESIENNPNIQWKLDDGAWLTSDSTKSSWDKLIEAIEALDGGESYAAGELPAAFNANQYHTISWQWIFTTAGDADSNGIDDQDETDTAMGNAGDLADVTIKITITATQVD